MDDLDLLISNALGESEASDPEPDETETPESEEATEPSAVEETVEESEEDPSEDEAEELDDEEPDADPEGTPSTDQSETVEPPASTTPDDYETLRRKAAFQDKVLQQLATAQQRKKEQDDAARAEQERTDRIEALKREWAEMDPEEAANSKLAFVAREAENTILTLQQKVDLLEQAKAAEAEARDEAEAKAEAIPLIMEKHGLKPEDKKVLEKLNTPAAMVEVAEYLRSQRQNQTAKAREVKAAKAKANPALKVTTPGTTAPKQKPAYENVDDLLDAMFPG